MNPLRVTHALHEPLERYRSADAGSFRMLVEVDARTHVIHIVHVAYHADVYRSVP
jgi:mRNA-degrading endonuclease RelE of RelBE toxin-antitoxin system